MSDSDIYEHDGDTVSDGLDEDALIPADGYFTAADGDAAGIGSNASEYLSPADGHRDLSDMPRVPNVLVADPTPSAGESKRREAQREAESSADQQHQTQASPRGQAASSHDEAATEASQTSATTQPTQHHTGQEERNLFQQYRRQQPQPLSTNIPPSSQRNYDAPPAYYPSESPILARNELADAMSPSQTSHSYGTIDRQLSHESFSRDRASTSADEYRPLLIHDEESSRRESSSGMVTGSEELRPPAKPRSSRRWVQIVISLLFILIMLGLATLFAIISIPIIREPNYQDTTPIRPPDTKLPEFVWKNQHSCKNTFTMSQAGSQYVQMDSDKSLRVVQAISLDKDTDYGTENQISGEIIIQSDPNGAKGVIRVGVESIVNDERLLVKTDTQLVGSRRTVTATSPLYIQDWNDKDGGPCTLIRMVIHVPPGSAFYNFEIGSTHLGLTVRNGVWLIAQTVKFAVGTMTITVPKLSDQDNEKGIEPYRMQAKYIDVTLVSGSLIQGWYPMYNSLEIEAAIGDINVQITPKQAAKGVPDTASLTVATGAGNIRITEFSHDDNRTEASNYILPVRSYESQMSSLLGNITAKLMMTTSLSADAHAGMDLDILPVLSLESDTKHNVVNMITSSRSGETKVNIREPIFAKGTFNFQESKTAYETGEQVVGGAAIVGNAERLVLRSRHYTYKGDLNLCYPRDWSGDIKWHGLTGGVMLGSGVQIIRTGGTNLKYMDAIRGVGSSEVMLDNEWGSTNLLWNGD